MAYILETVSMRTKFHKHLIKTKLNVSKALLQLVETFIHTLATSEINDRKMPALIPVRVITKVNREHY